MGGLAVVWAGCGRPEREKSYVARVGDAVLTSEQVREHSGQTDGDAARDYVAAWVANEILYQEARRRGLADSEEIRKQIEEARRQFAIAALLEREVYSADTAAISEEDLRREFEANRESYRLREDVAHISFAMFGEREAANVFRSKVLQGVTWGAALDSVKQEFQESVLRSAERQLFTQADLYPEELWKAARALRKEDISYVIRTQAGYAVMIVHSTKAQGEIPDFDYVREEIRSRLLLEKRRERYNALVERLRSQHKVELQFSNDQQKGQE